MGIYRIFFRDVPSRDVPEFGQSVLKKLFDLPTLKKKVLDVSSHPDSGKMDISTRAHQQHGNMFEPCIPSGYD